MAAATIILPPPLLLLPFAHPVPSALSDCLDAARRR